MHLRQSSMREQVSFARMVERVSKVSSSTSRWKIISMESSSGTLVNRLTTSKLTILSSRDILVTLSLLTKSEEFLMEDSTLPELLMKNVIYEVPCQDCASVYIGEAGRCLQVRLKEHRGAVRCCDKKNGTETTE